MNKFILSILVFIAASAMPTITQTRKATVARKKTVVTRKTPIAKKRTVIKKMTTTPAIKSAAITTESGLTYIVTKHGDGAQLKAGDEVIVNYTGMLTSGKKFDSSLDRGQPFSFPLGAGRVIKGWDEALQQLRIGDHATLILPSTIAYGSRAMGDDIPADSTLIFIIEVVGVK
ncbi:MAG: FKBP-type peptidyl-prolyl cis-trans isomerase [Pyrinomonadaceae bacterium]